MKKFSFVLMLLYAGLFLHAQNGNLKIGDKATDWKFTDADKVEHSMDTWKGKVLQINYVDPDESDLNDPFNDAIDKAVDVDKIIPKEQFKGFGIVDCKSTWKPNGLIRLIAGKKAEKYETTILFDYDAVLQTQWGLPEDSYSVVIVDKNRVVRALYKGKIPDEEIPGIIKLIIELTKE